MLWTSLALWIYVCCRHKVKWPAFAFCVYIGYSVKPTVIFVALALIAIKLCSFLKSRTSTTVALPQMRSVWQIAKSVTAIALGLFLAFGFVQAARLPVDNLKTEQNFSYTHFLMMGFNPEQEGAYASEDVLLSGSSPTCEERKIANLQTWAERIRQMGPLGVTKLLAKKTCTNYADGSFAWENEGTFYVETHGSNTLIKQVYGIDREPNLFESPYQIIWLLLLSGSAIACFALRKKSDTVSVICLTLLLLSIFLTLFECRARYLFLFSPYYVLLGGLGWLSLTQTASGVLHRTHQTKSS